MIRASSLHRYRMCAGAPAAEKGVPESTERAWTGEGRQVHDALQFPDKLAELPPHLEEIAESMAMTADWLVERIFPDKEGYTRGEVIRERQFFVEHNGEKIISGHPDFIQIGTVMGKKSALILDFKSGYLDVPQPACNDQLRSYSVMLWQDPDLGIEEVYACIVPRMRRTPAPVHYSSQDLPLALNDLVTVYEAAQEANAVRVPSISACRYCRARATSRCPETLYPPKVLKEMPALIALTPEQKGDLLTLCELVTANIKCLKERLEEELKTNPDAVDGWHLAPGDFRSSIPDAGAAYNAVSGMMSSEEFQECLKVNITDLKGELKAKLKESEGIKGKAAVQRIDTILEPVVIRKQGEMKLARKTETVEE